MYDLLPGKMYVLSGGPFLQNHCSINIIHSICSHFKSMFLNFFFSFSCTMLVMCKQFRFFLPSNVFTFVLCNRCGGVFDKWSGS